MIGNRQPSGEKGAEPSLQSTRGLYQLIWSLKTPSACNRIHMLLQ